MAETIPPPIVPTKTRHALVVGVNSALQGMYPGPLRYAEEQARMVAEVLQTVCGCDLVCEPLIGAQATSAAIRDALKTLAVKRTEQDLLLFYFAGHGYIYEENTQQRQVYLLASDFDPDAIEAGEDLDSVSLGLLRERLYERTKAGRVLVLLDCCYAGNSGRVSYDAPLDSMFALFKHYLGATSDPSKEQYRVTLAATGHDAEAWEDEHGGIWTQHLLAALRGECRDAYDEDGEVTVGRLHDVLYKSMPETQKPSFSGDTAGKDLVLVRYPERSERARQLAVRSEFVQATASQYQPHQTDLLRARQQQQLELSLLLAIEAIKRYHVRDADLALRHALAQHGTILASLPHVGNVQRVAMSGDGHYLATTSQKMIHLWKRAGNGTMQTFANFSHAGPGTASTIHTLAFSPDSQYLVTASGNTVYVWNVESRGEEVIALEEHQRRVKFVAFSHENRFLVTASDDALVKVWRWQERQGEQVEHWDLPHERGVAALALSPDGRTLATAAGDNICRLWDMMEQRLQRELPAHGATVRALAFRPDGRALATASWDETAMVWDTASGERLLRKPLYHDGPVSALAFSPNGSYLATACKEEALLWNARQGTLRTRLQHQEKVNTVHFSHDSHFLVTASDDQAARVWETYTGDQVTRFAHQKPINTLALAQSVLATSEDSAMVRLWQVSRGDQYVCLLHNETINHLAFAPSGQLLATICNDDITRVWSLSSGKIRLRIEHDDRVNTVAWSADGRYIATGGDDGKVNIWDVRQEREQWCLQYEHSVHLVAFGPGREPCVLAIAGDDRTAQLVELREGSDPSLRPLPHGERVNAVAFSPDGQRLATVSDDGAAQLWDVVSGQRLFEPLHHEGTALTVAFSPAGGRFFATGSGHMDVQCWDAVNRQEQPLSYQHCEDFVNTLVFSQDGHYLAVGTKGETGGVYDVSVMGQIKLRFSFQFEVSARALVFCPPDGNYLATAEEDGLITIWESASGRQLAWPGHTGSRYRCEVNALAFSPDGRFLATGGSDGTAALWLWQPEDLIKAASTRLLHDFNPEEWKRHLGHEPYYRTGP